MLGGWIATFQVDSLQDKKTECFDRWKKAEKRANKLSQEVAGLRQKVVNSFPLSLPMFLSLYVFWGFERSTVRVKQRTFPASLVTLWSVSDRIFMGRVVLVLVLDGNHHRITIWNCNGESLEIN